MWTTRALRRVVQSQPPRISKFAQYKIAADEWLLTTWGRRLRVGLLAATITVYPCYRLLVNGPFVRRAAEWRTPQEALPPHLQELVDEEYQAWLVRIGRAEKDARVDFQTQSKMTQLDSENVGSSSMRFGARIVLPCYARLRSLADAAQFCTQRLQPFDFARTTTCILWDTKFGKELMETMILSKNALRFLIARDLETSDGYQAFANKSISWATFHAFAALFIYGFHARRKVPTVRAFATLYSIFTLAAAYASSEWHKLYCYMTDVHADNEACRVSSDHCAGANEFYLKFLRRNQLLRSVMEKGPALFTPAGDLYDAPTPYLTRFMLVKDVTQEFSDFTPTRAGDVF